MLTKPAPLQRIALLVALALMAGCKTVIVNCPAQQTPGVVTVPMKFSPGTFTADCTPEKCPSLPWMTLEALTR